MRIHAVSRAAFSSRGFGGLTCMLPALFLLAASGCQLSAGIKSDSTETVAFVVLGEDGAALARVLTDAAQCPMMRIDGKSTPMDLRAGAAIIPLRTTRSAPIDSKPSAFPVLTCEKRIPAHSKNVRIGDQRLPLPRAEPKRIVVIGDTGCRTKSGETYQACNDAAKYTFAQIAKTAARWKPDLVIHVGDYLYRENACPQGNAGCAGNAWGYGWDAWREDLFNPGSPLLQAAPWVMVRGNHESCARAGQGWWRFLDVHPLLSGRDCNDPANDDIGDYSDPYAVPLGDGTQLIVLDTSNTITAPISPEEVRATKYRELYRQLDKLAQQQPHAILANHQPILGLAAKQDAQGALSVHASSQGIASVFATLNPLILPAQVQLMLAGHTHLWEQLSFSSEHPTQFIAGFSGTLEDVVPMPPSLPQGATPAAGVVVDAASSWVHGFGFMTMERRGPDRWTITVWDAHGEALNACEVIGRKSHCKLAWVAAQ